MNNTMKLEQQVTSLELSKKLKELGVKQDSLFYWWLDPTVEGDIPEIVDHKPIKDIEGGMLSLYDVYSAFTVAELGEMLPVRIGENTHLECWFTALDEGMKYYHVGYRNNNDATQNEKTEADARAKMLIWLIERDYITQ